jgi:hypothetical protein
VNVTDYEVIKWVHIIAVVYWLGGEWGVFQTSYHVTNPRLPLEERRRHMETAYRIDILARTGIILLLPLGLQLGHMMGVHPYGGVWLVVMWIAFAAWLSITWGAFFRRDTEAGLRLTLWDERIRYVVIPALVVAAVASLLTRTPFAVHWYSTKVLIYAGLLVIGLVLRYVMRNWNAIFRQLAVDGPNAALEAKLNSEIGMARKLAYVYWIGIGTNAFLGVAKPF